MFHPCTKTRLLLSIVVGTLLWMYLVNLYYDGAIIYNHTAKQPKHKPTWCTKNTTDNHTIKEEKNKAAAGAQNRTIVHSSMNRNHHHPWSTIEEVPNVVVRHADCKALFHNSTFEQHRINKFVNKTRSNILTQTTNCEAFRKERQYMMSATSQEEAEFPLAFNIMMYRNPEMAERLLRAIYRPQNVYCIHVDAKTEAGVYDMMHSVADCFPNVMMAQRVNVTWGTMSVVESELECMRTLWKYEWEYLINLTGEEFPLKTNSQIVRMLKTFKGTNGVHGSVKWANPERWGDYRKHPPPHNITLTKGSLHFAVTRGFVDFVLHNPISYEFQKWVSNTHVPDETFFSSLNHNPHLGVPGSHKKLDEEGKHCPFLVRYKLWLKKRNPKNPIPRCYGISSHNLCIFGVKDLPTLMNKPQMFVNKFHADYQPLAYDCMEELHYNRTREEILVASTYNTQRNITRTL